LKGEAGRKFPLRGRGSKVGAYVPLGEGKDEAKFQIFLVELNTGGYGHGERKTPRING
jgi:hypothetical protein